MEIDARPKILLVDDEPFNLDYLEQELEDQEVDILTATNGQEALDAVAEHQPAMIFLDIMMPVLNGFEVLKRLKSDPRWNSIPVVIISAFSDLSSIVKAVEMGAEDFLPKPFDPVLLHARLNAGLEKKRLRDVERRYLRALERELEIGRKIQAGFLPREIPQPPGWEIAAFFRPAREVAGDFYDVFGLDERKLALLLGDVSDKGVGAALYMALFRTLLRTVLMTEICTESIQPGTEIPLEVRLKQAVTLVNEYICRVHDSAKFATLFYGILDVESGQLCYINAGHDFPCILRGSRIHDKLKTTGPLVGAIEGADYETRIRQLEPGDTLVLYSDGITDVQNQAGEMFQEERWLSLLAQLVPSSQTLIGHLTDCVLGFMGDAPQYDDISLVTVRRL